MSLFEKKSKWIVLATYNEGGQDYIVQACKGKSGMLYFKTKRISPRFECSYNFHSKLFDIKQQFEYLLDSRWQ